MEFYAATSIKENIDDVILEITTEIKSKTSNTRIDLAFVFASPHFQKQHETLINSIYDSFKPTVTMGCMGESIIGNNKEIENKPAVTIWLASLPDVKVTPFHLKYIEKNGERLFINWPDDMPSKDDNPAFIVIAEPFSVDPMQLLSYFQNNYSGKPVIGGMASGAYSQGGNSIFYNGEILTNGVVGVALNGAIKVNSVVSQGCRPIGKPFIITKSNKNIIYSLGSKPALQCYREIYNDLVHEDKLLAQMGTHMGLVVNEYLEKFESGDFLARNLTGADEDSGAIAIADFVRVGQTAQFMIRDAKSAHDDLLHLLSQERDKDIQNLPKGGLIFTCNGRGSNLFTEPNHDVGCFKKILGDIPVGGFFAQGEIGPVGDVNFLHGFTASVALFSEPQGSEL